MNNLDARNWLETRNGGLQNPIQRIQVRENRSMQETNYHKEKEPHMLNKVTIENQHTMVKGGAKTTEITRVLVSHAVEIQEQNNLNIASANIFTDRHEDPPGEESEITKTPRSHTEIQPETYWDYYDIMHEKEDNSGEHRQEPMEGMVGSNKN